MYVSVINKYIHVYSSIILVSAHLSFPIYSYNSTASLMDSSHKDGVSTNSVHIDTCARLKVVQVNVSKFGDKINNIIFSTGL